MKGQSTLRINQEQMVAIVNRWWQQKVYAPVEKDEVVDVVASDGAYSIVITSLADQPEADYELEDQLTG